MYIGKIVCVYLKWNRNWHVEVKTEIEVPVNFVAADVFYVADIYWMQSLLNVSSPVQDFFVVLAFI